MDYLTWEDNLNMYVWADGYSNCDRGYLVTYNSFGDVRRENWRV